MTEPADVTLLGSLAIGSTPADGALGGRRAELAFAFLAAEHHRPVTRDELAEALWPTGLPPSWMSALRAVIAQVRRFVRSAGLDEALVTGRSTYQLLLPPDAATDIDGVHDRVGLAESLLDAGDPDGALVAARSVSRLAGLPFLPHEEGAWIDGMRRSLRRGLGRALAVEAQAGAALGDPQGAADAAARLVEVQPIDEAAHRLRIRLLAETGDAAGAARAYEDCRRALAEVGIEPAAETAAARQAPAARAAPGPAGPAAPEPADRPGRIGVLVVEDHDFQRRTLVQVLEGLGVGWVEGVADGDAGMHRLAEAPRPDLVLCDIDMPRMDGVEFVRHLGASGTCPAVAFTSALEPAVLRSVEALGAGYGLEVLGVLPKPVTARRLRELLRGFSPPTETAPAGHGEHGLQPDSLRRAIGSGELSAEVQPRLDLSTGELAAVTVTPSWRRGTGDPVPVRAIHDLAAAGGSADELCGELLRRAARLLTGRTRVPSVVLRLPQSLFADLGLADRWVERVDRLGLQPGRVTVEVDLRDHPTRPEVLDVLTRLRLKGFGVSLSGYDGGSAALACGERLPLTGLTLAGHLLSGAAADPARRDRLEGVIDVAAGMELPVVADGCDDHDDYVLALTVGCDMVQGAQVGRPMPVGSLSHWMVARAPVAPHGT